ncbi:hypothetical protein GALMADRAFT_213957 [Galerina marginata CBS 339.88]|uniref:Uncharacterized protein n=1 Tax=Galerina marginata (strain CBS 339.88) TaxID=685588 RepID=A0A067SK25_GALM3|nr:hypothetical protein GALMADRAFT_213957 [Galerina marginata CBS 339.88]
MQSPTSCSRSLTSSSWADATDEEEREEGSRDEGRLPFSFPCAALREHSLQVRRRLGFGVGISFREDDNFNLNFNLPPQLLQPEHSSRPVNPHAQGLPASGTFNSAYWVYVAYLLTLVWRERICDDISDDEDERQEFEGGWRRRKTEGVHLLRPPVERRYFVIEERNMDTNMLRFTQLDYTLRISSFAISYLSCGVELILPWDWRSLSVVGWTRWAEGEERNWRCLDMAMAEHEEEEAEQEQEQEEEEEEQRSSW